MEEIETGIVNLHTGVFRRHFHEFWTFACVLEGHCDVEYGTKHLLGNEGMLTVIAPGVVHAGAARDRCLRYVFVNVPDATMNAAGMKDLPIDAKLTASSQARAHFTALTGALEAKRPDDFEVLEKIILLTSSFCGEASDFSPNLKVRSQTGLGPAKDYLRTTATGKPTLAAASALANLHPSHFIRRFRHAFGLPPMEYVSLCRIAAAKDMLATGASIADAAVNCGFSDQSHLTRVFKQYVGLTPGAYLNDVIRYGGQRAKIVQSI